MYTMPNAICLFAGAGGDSLGLENAGYNVIAYSENNINAIETHEARFPHSTLLRDPETNSTDIRKIPDDIFMPYKGDVELVMAGFPCQGFSHAGKKKHDDPRNELVHEFARVVSLVRPRWFVGENVRGLLGRKGRDPNLPPTAPLRPVIDIIRDVFQRIGYTITYNVINVTTVGVPQLRKRLLIVGFRGRTFYPHVPWERLTTPPEPAATIRPFLETHLDGAVPYTKADIGDDHFWITTTETTPTGTPHPNLLRLTNGIRNLSSQERAAATTTPTSLQVVDPAGLISFGTRKSSYHGQVLDPDGPSKTIICTYGLCPRLFVGLHNPTTGQRWVRCLSVRELAQIQGFPADYPWCGSDKAKITQIGNAVPPPLATAIANAIYHTTCRRYPQVAAGTSGDASDDEAIDSD
jgi:DNA (cytosine-5)-methyltransferase 1